MLHISGGWQVYFGGTMGTLVCTPTGTIIDHIIWIGRNEFCVRLFDVKNGFKFCANFFHTLSHVRPMRGHVSPVHPTITTFSD